MFLLHDLLQLVAVFLDEHFDNLPPEALGVEAEVTKIHEVE
jgi:hypothetical protein